MIFKLLILKFVKKVLITLPDHIKTSAILSDEHLHMLAQVDEIPSIDPMYEDARLKEIFQYYALTPREMDVELHKYAAELLKQGRLYEAWQVLLSDELM